MNGRNFSHRYVPHWLVVTDKSVLAGYYKDRGTFYDNTFYVAEYFNAWLVPCLAWCTVIIALLICMLVINLLVRKHWTTHERLTYPLAQIPLDIINNGPRLFKTRLIWTGFAISVAFNLINGIHTLFPVAPRIFYGTLPSKSVFHREAVERTGLDSDRISPIRNRVGILYAAGPLFLLLVFLLALAARAGGGNSLLRWQHAGRVPFYMGAIHRHLRSNFTYDIVGVAVYRTGNSTEFF